MHYGPRRALPARLEASIPVIETRLVRIRTLRVRLATRWVVVGPWTITAIRAARHGSQSGYRSLADCAESWHLPRKGYELRGCLHCSAVGLVREELRLPLTWNVYALAAFGAAPERPVDRMKTALTRHFETCRRCTELP